MAAIRVGRWVTTLATVLGALLLVAALDAPPVDAQAACEVNGTPVDCDSPEVVGAHPPFCAYSHWHGVLDGQPDPNPGGCGHGPVTRGGAPLIRIFQSPTDLLIDLGFTPDQAIQMVEGGRAEPFLTSDFRFATDPSGPPTINPPFGHVVSAGASFVSVSPGFPANEIQCDNSPDPLLGAPGEDGILVLCDGSGTLVPGEDYVVIHGQLGGDFPAAAPFFQNYSFPLAFPGQPTWQESPVYPGDTWQDASVIPYVTQEPGGTGFFQFATSVVGPDGSLSDVRTGSVFVAAGDSMFTFVPATQFPGLGPDTIGDLGFGVAVHIHDGSFGSCADCSSLVSVFPPVPREVGLFTRPGEDWPFIDTAAVIGSNPVATIQPGGPSTTEGTPVGGGSDETLGGASDDGGVPFGLIAGGLLVIAAGGGGTYYWKQRGPAMAGVPGNAPAAPPREDGPPTSAFLGNVEIDPEIAAGLAMSFPDPQASTAPPPPPPAVTNRERADWETALIREGEAQERLMAEFQRLLDQVNAAWAEYRSAVDRFRSRYSRMLSGSTEMQGLLATWAETREIAKKQDLAFAIVTLLWSGGALALKGARWLKGGARAADAATDAGRAGAQVAEYSSDAPNFWKLFDMLNAKKAAGTERLAAEAGLDFAELMAAHGDDLDAVLPIVLEGAARARGWVSMAPEAENLISRLLVNGRGALGGRMATLAAEDVATLQRWAQQPGFWERLGKAAGMMDEVGWLGSQADVHQYISLLYSADDINFLRKVAESGGDLVKLGELLGPAQRTALASLNQTLATVVGNAPTFLAPGAAHTAAYNAWQGDPVSQLGDAAQFVDQFGITSKFGDLDAAISAGSITGTAGAGVKLLGSELWDTISSPFETYQEYKFTFEALDVFERFMQDHLSDLQGMSSALNDGHAALDRLKGTLERAGLSGDTGPLHRRMQDLRDVLDGMKRQYDGADQQWRDEFGDQYRERKAHIEEKLAYVSGVEAQFEEMASHVPQMLDWLDSLRRPGGQIRSLTSFIDPEIGVRMISIQTYLDQSLSAAYRNPLSAAPSTEPAALSPSTDGGSDGVFTDEAPTLDQPTASEAELEARWQEQMKQLEAQWDEFESIPQDYELDVDLDFSDD